MYSGAIISLINSSVALIISIIALIYTVKTYLLKSGISIRGSFGVCSDRACKDKYISRITLENLKDKSTVIFKIYLQIGHNYFLEVEDFGDTPLILKPFEAFNKEYGPVDLYSVSLSRIELNGILSSKKVKKKIVLSTSKGKYIVNNYIKSWDPLIDFFKNYSTIIINVRRTVYKNKSYGENVRYIVDIKTENSEQIIPIYPEDHELVKFNGFQLTKDCLESKEDLELFFNDLKKSKLISFEKINILDMRDNFERKYELERQQEPIVAKSYGYYKYKILGWLLTRNQNHLIREKNKKYRKKS